MTNLTVFDFKGSAVRSIVDDQGMPWFVGKDVCDCLEIVKHHQALGRLQEDERGTYIIGTPSGPQKMTCISEPGVYRLIMTSRVEAAEYFKRWLCHEVLPSLRHTGRYDMGQGSGVGQEPGTLGASDARAYAQLLGQVRSIYGPLGADKVYRKLPLPEIEDESESLKFDRRYGATEFDMGEDQVEEATNGWTLLDNLMTVEYANNGSPVRKSVGEIFASALAGQHSGKSMLTGKGILIDPPGWDGYVAFPEQCPFLARVLACTYWAMDWVIPLSTLPGAQVVKLKHFPGRKKGGVVVPIKIILEVAESNGFSAAA